MGMIKGITIQIIKKVETGKDDFGHPIYDEVEEDVENVIVAPVNSNDVLSNTNLEGHTISYQLGIPKGDTHDWTNTKVKFFGETWRTVGIPLEGIEAMIPLSWNKKVSVERYE